MIKRSVSKKEFITVSVITVLLIFGALLWAVVYGWIFTEVFDLLWIRIPIIAIMVGFIIVIFIVLVQRIKELKKGENDDLGKY